MKYKYIIIELLIFLVLLSSGCRFREEELIYKNPEQISGAIIDDVDLTNSQVNYITKDNIKQAKNKLPGLQTLHLNREVALYVSLGEKPTGGYQILITEIRKKNNKLIISVKAGRPKEGQFVTQAVTYPHDIVKLPLAEVKGITEIKFKTNQNINLKIN